MALLLVLLGTAHRPASLPTVVKGQRKAHCCAPAHQNGGRGTIVHCTAYRDYRADACENGESNDRRSRRRLGARHGRSLPLFALDTPSEIDYMEASGRDRHAERDRCGIVTRSLTSPGSSHRA